MDSSNPVGRVRRAEICGVLVALLLACTEHERDRASDAGAQESSMTDASNAGSGDGGAAGGATSGNAGSHGGTGSAGSSGGAGRAGRAGSSSFAGSTGTRPPLSTDSGVPTRGPGEEPLPCDQLPQQITKLDMLFVVDNSGSMLEEQEALREQFPRLIGDLIRADLDFDGMRDFPSIDLHLGVVSTDLGVPGMDVEKCDGLGDDGLLRSTPVEVSGCQSQYPSFLTYLPGVNDPMQAALDFGCMAALGTEGCGFEQPLESALKALWPRTDRRVTFLPDEQGFGNDGHGDGFNRGFLRNDPAMGRSLIAVIVVSDEEDCSSWTTRHFTPESQLEPDDPLRTQGYNVRCFSNPENLFPIERYVNGLRLLRPENPGLVLFAAIVGVPPELVTPEALMNVPWSNARSREAFYTQLLDHPDMQERLNGSTSLDLVNLEPSCTSSRGEAFPPRRIVHAARGFGDNGMVQSICAESFGTATDAILTRIAARLRNPCP